MLRLWLLGIVLMMSGCATTPVPNQPESKSATGLPGPMSAVPPSTPRKQGGYYLDDGPQDQTPKDLLSIPDAVPKDEPYLSGANRPYEVFGEVYFPDLSGLPFSERGIATWYGRKFHGKPTSSGEPYDMFAMTAAHKTLPIPSYARVSNVRTGQFVIVRINDRGPFFPGRVIDLSYTAAAKLGFAGKGSGEVLVERVFPGEGPRVGLAAADAPAKATVLSKGMYFLQLGAFSDRSNAERLIKQAKASLGEWANKLILDSDGQTHRVRMGPLGLDALDAASALVEKSLSIKPRVIGP